MKLVWTGLAALFSFMMNDPAYSADPPYHVTVGTESGVAGAQMAINFETRQQYSSMCHRTTVRLNVELPRVSNPPGPEVGYISFDTELKSDSICLMAFGPHRGGIELMMGDALPKIPDGDYHLRIDEEAYGAVRVQNGQATLIDDIPE